MSNRTCNSFLGLSCQESKCQCDSTQKYWSKKENKCVNLMSYGETGCNLDHECIGNLKCDFEICTCERSYFTEMYFNGTLCLEAGGSWAKCKKDYECKSSYKCLDIISRCSKSFFLSSLLRSGSACLNINNIYFLTFYSLLLVHFF